MTLASKTPGAATPATPAIGTNAAMHYASMLEAQKHAGRVLAFYAAIDAAGLMESLDSLLDDIRAESQPATIGTTQ